jgi:hypothetical protein
LLMLFGSVDAKPGGLSDVQLTALANGDFRTGLRRMRGGKISRSASATSRSPRRSRRTRWPTMPQAANSRMSGRNIAGAYAPGTMIGASQNLLYHKFSKG